MGNTAEKDAGLDPLDAISQIMADMDDDAAPASKAEAVEADEAEPAPVLDLTRRVNPDGTVTDLTNPGANSEERVQSAFAALREAVAEQGLKAPESADPALEADLVPHIKAWLDEHLPAIVERVVREEVERLARRG